jgi:methylglutaconyl-CoA hydratase
MTIERAAPEAPGQTQTRYAVHDGAAWITLDRPEVRNALSATLVDELYAHVAAALEDHGVRSIVITGAGSAFCAGADLKNPPGRASEGEGAARPVPYAELLRTLWHSPKPVVAAVNGSAFAGGLGLVGAADVVVTAENAIFCFSEVRIGVIPAIISVVCLPKLGANHAMRLFLGGHRFDGREAVAVGLAHRAVPAEQLADAVAEEVDSIRLGGPEAIAECKRLVRAIDRLDLDRAFDIAGEWSRLRFESAEAAEGMAAFREKRPPRWAAPPPEAATGEADEP